MGAERAKLSAEEVQVKLKSLTLLRDMFPRKPMRMLLEMVGLPEFRVDEA